MFTPNRPPDAWHVIFSRFTVVKNLGRRLGAGPDAVTCPDNLTGVDGGNVNYRFEVKDQPS
jgi:hypothetical protein